MSRKKETKMCKKVFERDVDSINIAKCAEAHMKAFETWPYGRKRETWKDEDGNICIRYATGKWFHYKIDKNGTVQWW